MNIFELYDGYTVLSFSHPPQKTDVRERMQPQMHYFHYPSIDKHIHRFEEVEISGQMLFENRKLMRIILGRCYYKNELHQLL